MFGFALTSIQSASHCPSVILDGSTYWHVRTVSNSSVSFSSAFFLPP